MLPFPGNSRSGPPGNTGRAWRIVPTYKPAPNGRGAFLNGVACATATACTAVGNQTPTRTLAERWNGQSWHVQATPNPAGQPALAGVACPTSSACTAFGLNFTGSGPATVAERWSGGKWRIQPTPALVAYDVAFPGVTCPTASVCYALSSYTNDGPGVSVVEQWNRAGTSTQGGVGPTGAAQRPALRLPPRPHAGLTARQRPDPSRGIAPVPSRQPPEPGRIAIASQPDLVRSQVTPTDPVTGELSCRQPAHGGHATPARRSGRRPSSRPATGSASPKRTAHGRTMARPRPGSEGRSTEVIKNRHECAKPAWQPALRREIR